MITTLPAAEPSTRFNSAAVEVTPSRTLISDAVTVTPLRIFSSAAVEVTAVPPSVSVLLAFSVVNKPDDGVVLPIATLSTVPPLMSADVIVSDDRVEPVTLPATVAPVTLVRSILAASKPPVVVPSWTWIVLLVVLTEISPSAPVNEVCCVAVPLRR